MSVAERREDSISCICMLVGRSHVPVRQCTNSGSLQVGHHSAGYFLYEDNRFQMIKRSRIIGTARVRP